MAFSLAGRMLLVSHIQWELEKQLRHLPVLILSTVVHEVRAEVMDENPGAVLGKMTMQRRSGFFNYAMTFSKCKETMGVSLGVVLFWREHGGVGRRF